MSLAAKPSTWDDQSRGTNPSEMSAVSRRHRPVLGSTVIIGSKRSGGSSRSPDLLDRVKQRIDADGTASRAGLDPEQAELGCQLEAARRTEFNTVVAVGGDGTINAAAGLAVEKDAALAIVPAGTMNLLAKDLGIVCDLSKLDTLLSPVCEKRVDTATVNGHLFLHSSHLGMVPHLTPHREQIRREPNPMNRIRLVASFVRRACSSPSFTVELSNDAGRAVMRRTRALAVTNNPLDADSLVSYQRADIDQGTLQVYTSRHAGRLASTRLALSVAAGQFTHDASFESFPCKTLVIRSSRRRVRVANDGEVITLTTPLRYEIHPRRLRVLLPARPEDPEQR